MRLATVHMLSVTTLYILKELKVHGRMQVEKKGHLAR